MCKVRGGGILSERWKGKSIVFKPAKGRVPVFICFILLPVLASAFDGGCA
jgi:hypothetical protein